MTEVRSAMKKAIGQISISPRTRLRTTPLWTPKDGITFSLLSKFIIDRHRFWIRTVLGLREDIGFNHRIEFGSLLHAGFEEFSRHKPSVGLETRIEKSSIGIQNYGNKLRNTHLGFSEEIDFWEKLAVFQFGQYARYWKKCDQQREYVFQERTFDVQTKLPSGRSIRLRGKYDEGFLEKKKSGKSYLVLQENKSKGDIDSEGIMSALNIDLQTMMYLHCLSEEGMDCQNILYNVVLRPMGGKYPMRQKKGRVIKGKRIGAESTEEFRMRGELDIKKNPTKYFSRYPVTLDPKDLDNFRYRCFFPYLESLLDWWESIENNPMDPWNTYRYIPYTTKCSFCNGMGGFTNNKKWRQCKKCVTGEIVGSRGSKAPNMNHFLRPFGVFDSLALGNRGDYFDFVISNGTELKGLKQLDSVFPELDDPSLSKDRNEKTTKASKKNNQRTVK